jgi:hypothetical protein
MIADDVAAGHLVRLDFDVPAMLRTKYGLVYLENRTLASARCSSMPCAA